MSSTLSVILAKFSCVHTQRSTEQLPWKNHSKRLSWPSLPDANFPGKICCFSACQNELQSKQNKILSECVVWLAHDRALSYINSKIPGKWESIWNFLLKIGKSGPTLLRRSDRFLHSWVSLSFPNTCARMLNKKYNILQLSQNITRTTCNIPVMGHLCQHFPGPKPVLTSDLAFSRLAIYTGLFL